jgi:hypothetical protein
LVQYRNQGIQDITIDREQVNCPSSLTIN